MAARFRTKTAVCYVLQGIRKTNKRKPFMSRVGVFSHSAPCAPSKRASLTSVLKPSELAAHETVEAVPEPPESSASSSVSVPGSDMVSRSKERSMASPLAEYRVMKTTQETPQKNQSFVKHAAAQACGGQSRRAGGGGGG